MMRCLSAALTLAVLAEVATAEDILWRPAQPLVKVFDPFGRILLAGPHPAWTGSQDSAKARLGMPGQAADFEPIASGKPFADALLPPPKPLPPNLADRPSANPSQAKRLTPPQAERPTPPQTHFATAR